MTRFDTKWGAGVLALLATVYLTVSLATGRTARSEQPPDLRASAADVGLDVWKTAAALLGPTPGVVVDVRAAEEYARYHLPNAVNEPGADAAALQALAQNGAAVIVVAAKDESAQKLVGEARAADPRGSYYYLQDGARSWYLAFELPVAMFSETPPPLGYDAAIVSVRSFFHGSGARDQALVAVETLAKLSYSPTLLKQSGKPKAAAARKKISGGCGG